MSVRKRKFKNGVRWFVDVTFPNGTRYRRIVGTKKQAELVQKRIDAEIVEGRWDVRETEEIPFSALVLEYLDYAEANKAASTYSADRCRIEGHLLPYFGDTLLSQITPQMVDSYKSMRVRDDAAPKSINHELSNLAHMMKMAVRWGYVKDNVAARVEKLKLVKNPSRFLSNGEIDSLLSAAESYCVYPHIYPLLVTALHTGMRKSELFNLKWTDMDFGHNVITVQSKDDWHTKNYRSRVLALTPKLREVLLTHRDEQKRRGVHSDYVFTHKGMKLRSTVKKSLRTVLREAGLVGVTLHTLRHTFASQLVMAGVPLRKVQELMGHQSFETTLQYAHLSQDHVKQEVLRLPYATA